jgi:tripartite-type tricarboxylate transporter receptor subunit TctC
MNARIALLAALVLAPAVTATQAQLVTRPIMFVVPYSPGGNVDVSARILQAGIGDALGQPIIVENKPGAGGMLAGDYVARAEPDGQTLFVGSNGPLVLGPMAMPNAPYQWDKVFAPVSTLAVATNVLLVNPQLPIHSVVELVAYAKANPGKLTLETDTPVSINHFMAELFRLKTSIDWVEVNYHGNAPALADLIAGHVDIGFQQLVDAVQLIRDGKLRALAVLGAKRAAALPDVPTIAEAGYPDVGGVTFSGVLAPKATPRATVDKLSATIRTALQKQTVIGQLAALGSEAGGSTPEAFTDFLIKDTRKWSDVMKQANIKVSE